MKWDAVVVVGWYWVGSWMVLLFLLLLGTLEKRGSLTRVVVREREKKNKLLLYTTIVTV